MNTTNAATADAWTDQQYLQHLAEHYADSPVPEIRAHSDRLLAIAAALASTAAQPPAGLVMVPVDALQRWLCAFSEELAAYDINPPIHHVKASHDEIAALLASAPKAEPAPAGEYQPPEPSNDDIRAIAREARNRSGSASDDCGPSGYVLAGWKAAVSALSHAPSIDDLCARIKAADDAAADRDYMLDSDDCIAVLRGEWKGSLAMDKPDRAMRAQPAVAPAAPAAVAGPSERLRDELVDLARSIVALYKESSTVLQVHVENMADLLEQLAAEPATQAAPAISAGDAVFAFTSMLTALPRVVPFGAAAWATPGVELATAFNAANGFCVSQNFPDGLVFPKIDGDLLAVVEKAAAPQPAAQQRAELWKLIDNYASECDTSCSTQSTAQDAADIATARAALDTMLDALFAAQPKSAAQQGDALRPFAEIGAWMLARPQVPDDTPVVTVQGINGCDWVLTRGDFKHAALAAQPQEAAPGAHGDALTYERGYRYGYERRDAEVKGALV